MEDPIRNYWQIRLGELKAAVEDNDFKVFWQKMLMRQKRLFSDPRFPTRLARPLYGGLARRFSGGPDTEPTVAFTSSVIQLRKERPLNLGIGALTHGAAFLKIIVSDIPPIEQE